jgi:hypothetical protein
VGCGERVWREGVARRVWRTCTGTIASSAAFVALIGDAIGSDVAAFEPAYL